MPVIVDGYEFPTQAAADAFRKAKPKNAGVVVDGYEFPTQAAADAFKKARAPKDTSSPASMAVEAVKGGVWDTLTGAASLAGNLVTHPVDTVGNIVGGIARGHMNEAGQALEAAKRGDVVSALGHGLYAAMPVIGPAMSQANAVAFDPNKTGDERARAFGQAAAMLVPMPKVAKALPEKVRMGMRQNQAIKEITDFAERRGVPMDAASSTDNMFVRGVQQVSGSTMGGSVPAAKGRTAQADALRRVAGELADETGAAATSPADAGRRVAQALDDTKTMRGDLASDAYGDFRAANAAWPMDANIKPIQDWAVAKLEEIKRPFKSPNPQAAAAHAQEIAMLEDIISKPSLMNVADAEISLGNLKKLVRNTEDATRTTRTANSIIDTLQGEIENTVLAQGGPQALDALKQGRQNWAKRSQLREVEKELSLEPAKAMASLTERGDRSIEKLKRVAEVVPGQIPEVGRAFVQEMFDKAMDEGGFKGGQGMLAKWESLGPETKSMLFPDAAHRADLDKFMKLSARISRVPNTSGTAGAMAASGSIGAFGAAAAGGSILPFIASEIGSYGLSKAMHNPRFVRMLNQGLTLPARSSAQKLVVGKLLDMARKQGEETQ